MFQLFIHRWIAVTCLTVLSASALSAGNIPVLDAHDDFIETDGSSTFFDPLSNDAAYGLRTLDPTSFQLMGTPRHGQIAVEASAHEVQVGYFRNEPGAECVQYEICLTDGTCDTARLWFLEGDIGPLVSPYFDRREPIPVGSASLSGKVFVFVPDVFPQGTVSSVRFLLNGEPVMYEREAPYDLFGGTKTAAKPFDTTRFSDGLHVITTEIKFSREAGDHLERIETLACIRNSPMLAFSYSNDRSSAASFQDGFFGGTVFVFLGIFPINPGIGPIPWSLNGVSSVSFSLDGEFVRTERLAPYDLGGGSEGVANPFEMSLLPKGHHELRAIVDFDNGRQLVIKAGFEVIG